MLIIDYIWSYKVIKNFHNQLKKTPFHIAIKGVIDFKQKNKFKLKKDKVIEKMINRRLNAINQITTLFYRDGRCLYQTIAQYILLNKLVMLPVKFVIGVDKFPFSSHAWLVWRNEHNIEKRNVIDDYEDTVIYHIIFDSEKDYHRLDF